MVHYSLTCCWIRCWYDQIADSVMDGDNEILSIQMPVLANDAEYEDYVPLYPEVIPRLKAAEAFLIEKGITEIR